MITAIDTNTSEGYIFRTKDGKPLYLKQHVEDGVSSFEWIVVGTCYATFFPSRVVHITPDIEEANKRLGYTPLTCHAIRTVTTILTESPIPAGQAQ